MWDDSIKSIPGTRGYFEVSQLLGNPICFERLHDGVDKLDQHSIPVSDWPRITPLEAGHVLISVIDVQHSRLLLTRAALVFRDGAAKNKASILIDCP